LFEVDGNNNYFISFIMLASGTLANVAVTDALVSLYLKPGFFKGKCEVSGMDL